MQKLPILLDIGWGILQTEIMLLEGVSVFFVKTSKMIEFKRCMSWRGIQCLEDIKVMNSWLRAVVP
jgi:hypothetical protein